MEASFTEVYDIALQLIRDDNPSIVGIQGVISEIPQLIVKGIREARNRLPDGLEQVLDFFGEYKDDLGLGSIEHTIESLSDFIRNEFRALKITD